MKKDLSEHNLEAFAELERACEQQRYGSVNVWLSLHDGQITGIEGNQMQLLKFKDGENTKAVAIVLSEIKNLTEIQRSGNITFTLSLDKGQIKKLNLHRNLTRRFALRKSEGVSP